MTTWKRRIAWVLGAGVGLAVLLLGLAILLTGFITELWWYMSLDYGGYFWLRLLYRYIVFAGATAIFFLVFYLNFWLAAKYLGVTGPSQGGAPDTYLDVLSIFRRWSKKVYIPVCLILAVIVAFPMFDQWHKALLYVFGPDAGWQDPAYGNDVSYYLFSLPIYLLLLDRLFWTFLVLLVALFVLYWMERRFVPLHKEPLPRSARLHLSVLVLVLFFIEVFDFILQRHTILYSDSHVPLFSGPGFVEMNVIVPFIWLCMLLLAGTAFSLVYFFNKQKGLKLVIVFAVGFVLALGLRHSSLLPDLVQKFIVRPNEIAREKPYMNNNIQSTLKAYNLDKVETRDFKMDPIPWDEPPPKIQANLRNIPVWDGEVLHTAYKQVQEIRTYYDFPGVDVDRYTIGDVYQQVFVAPRELNMKQLPPESQSWVNEYLRYTHGYGAVMSPAAQSGGEPIQYFLQGIPPTSDHGVTVEEPGIYYGLRSNHVAIAPNDSGELDYPMGNSYKLTDYKGSGGVPIDSLFRKLLFAIRFKERNIFFTMKTNDQSRILFRRNIIERIRTLTPFFELDQDPYCVVGSKNLYWIQDAYVQSKWYPYSQPYEGDLNYIRNSVKIIVDAYNGTVDYYIADPEDPIIRAYDRMYPGVFKPFDEIPSELRKHIRYPKDFFDIQLGIYAKYHQTNPEVFYNQEDTWEFPEIDREDRKRTVKSYYLTLNLINSEVLEFTLLCPMNPKGRDNVRALAVAGCDGDNYARIILYSFPKGHLVFGPAQVDSLIDQDPEISQQFTLWNQRGSQVQRGKMILLPVGGSLLYIQPIFLAAESKVKIPELQRLIVSQAETVVMEPSLERAFTELNRRLADASASQEQQGAITVPSTQEGESMPLAIPSIEGVQD